MRGLQRGASYVPLIIVIVLLLFAVVWAYAKTSEVDHLKMELNRKTDEHSKELDRRTKLSTYLVQKVAPVTGFAIEAGSQDPPAEYATDTRKMEQFIRRNLTDLRDKYFREFPMSAYSVDERGGIKKEASGDKVKITYIEPGNIPSETTLELLYVNMASAMDRMLVDITRLVTEIDRLNQAAAAARTAYDNTITEKDSTIAQKTRDYNDLQSRSATREQELSANVNQLQDRVRESENALENEQKARRDEVAGLRSELVRAAQDVVKAKDRKLEREVPVGPDGEVLAVTDAQDVIVLNRGKDKHMMVGLNFDVYDFVKGALRRKKGTVVVIDVGANTARARVIERVNPMVPLVQGDLFESIAYNPEEQIHFFLLGRFDKYGKSDAARRLGELGALVDKTVGVETDFLVIGSPETEEDNLRESDEYRRAVELGVKVITEAQLSQFLNY
ncbi:MAG: hypothetical protein MUE73_11630 [Planctomycetes bacterium]|jgi:hypothetical protein|nr:hypothetical protein [Planctomycetota bacterium]